MCDSCFEYNFVCQNCGTILDPEFADKQCYLAQRKQLKDLLGTSPSGDAANRFVWFLRYRGRIVKVGYGSLQKLCNETRPNAAYCKFDSVFIYYCTDEDDRDIFATAAMGNIANIVNRKAVPNPRFVGKAALKFRNTVPFHVRNIILNDPDLVIGEAQYWDIAKLRGQGYV